MEWQRVTLDSVSRTEWQIVNSRQLPVINVRFRSFSGGFDRAERGKIHKMVGENALKLSETWNE